ncbi:MAG: hypothetical protein K8S27_07455 [Candidatus Omnitrophica bacterium]|nr:hypothetical protein [Candidatus Omnitrophota bacterium]
MKKWHDFSALLMIVFAVHLTSGCSISPEDGLVLDSFEGPIDASTLEYGAASGSTIKVQADRDIKECGQQALRLEYELMPKEYMYCARGYGLDVLGAIWEGPAPDKIDWQKYQGITFDMYGNTNGMLAFDVKDAGGELWRFLIEDRFVGWTVINCPFSEFKVRDDWQPTTADGNKVLDFPIQSFQWEPKTPGKGIFYFDCLKLK